MIWVSIMVSSKDWYIIHRWGVLPWIICWFWLDAKLINVVSIGGGWRDVKSIGGFVLETEDDIGSMACGCWPETIIGRGGCMAWLGAVIGDTNNSSVEFGAFMFIEFEGTLLFTWHGLKNDWEISVVFSENFDDDWKTK